MRFHKTYFFIAIALLITEISIAVFVRDQFIRPYFGDFLAVGLVYFSIRSVFKFPPIKVALFSLSFAFLLEFGQLFNVLELLDLQDNSWMKIVFGSSFSLEDLLLYALGAVGSRWIDQRFLNPVK